MTESEKAIQNQVLLEASRLGARVFRNNVGSAWMGDAVRHADGTVVIKHARRVVFGIPGEGGADLLGWYPYVVKPQDVGRQVALFTALEIKKIDGRVTPEQRQFLEIVAAAGGIAGVVRNPLELRELFSKTERT